MTSNGASATSPAPGAESKHKRKRAAAEEREVIIVLENGRMRHLGWLVIGGALGVFLLWRLGTVGQWLGVILMAVAAWHAFKLVRTLIYPPGTIDLQGDTAVLPTGLCRASAHETSWDKVRHAYFLRRAVPWSRTGPILVVETDERVLTYPRDWFRSDSDQRRVSQAIHRKIDRT